MSYSAHDAFLDLYAFFVNPGVFERIRRDLKECSNYIDYLYLGSYS